MLVVGALTPVVRRHNWRPRVSATGTAPAKLAWLVLSTLAATVSGLSYQLVQSGTCESAGGVDISSNLAECTAAGEALSIAWTWNLEYDSPHVPSGCIVTSTGSLLQPAGYGQGLWHCHLVDVVLRVPLHNRLFALAPAAASLGSGQRLLAAQRHERVVYCPLLQPWGLH